MSFPFNPNIPNANNAPKNDQPLMQQNNQTLNTALQIDHYFNNTGKDGTHKQITLTNEGAPGLGTGNGVLFANLANGQSWPFWQNGAAGSPFQIFGASSTVANGYSTLPGGIIIQWGSITGAPIANNQAVGFPLTFPTAVFSITLGPASNSTSDKTISIKTGTVGTGGFNVSCSGSSSFQTLYWLAIGN